MVVPATTPTVLKKLEKDLIRILDGLDRADERTQSVYSSNRSFERKGLRIPLRLLPPMVQHPTPSHEMIGYSREISRSGLSFVTQMHIVTEEVIVGMPAPNGETNWMRSEVKRTRELPDGFWEYGVAFLGKASITAPQ